MRTSRRFRNQKGQCSVEYTLLVGLVVFVILVFAKEYQLSLRGVAHTTMSTLSAATQALPPGPDGSAARGWDNDRSLTPHSLSDKLKHGLK